MNDEMLISLANNAALLLVLSIIYEAGYFIPPKYHRIRPVVHGLLIALVCVMIMLMPFTLEKGVVFDTRSILISVSVLFFGPLPALFTVVAASITRIIIGGPGMTAGLAVILSSALIGLAWRQWIMPKFKKWRWLNIYIMSLIIHGVMLACQLLIPYPLNMTVITSIALPVLLVYPVASILLSQLLERQQKNRDIQNLLNQSEDKYRRLYETTNQGVIYQKADGTVISANSAAERILGLTFDQMQGKSSTNSSWQTVDEAGFPLPGSEHPAIVALRTGKLVGPIILGVINPNTKMTVWLSISAIPLFEPGQSKPYQVYASFQDITAERTANQNYQNLFRQMQNAFALHEIICDQQGKPIDYRFLAINPAFERMTGLKAADIIGKTVLEAMPGTESYWIETYGKVALTGEPVEFEEYSAAIDKYFEVSAYQPSPGQFACTFIDISKRMKTEAELVYFSNHDYLTNLYNRRWFDTELKRLDEANEMPLSIIIGDINGLKLINDAFGLEEGDNLIVATANILRASCRKDDIVARTGGDEFSIILPRADRAFANDILKNIYKSCFEHNERVANEAFHINISLGFGTKDEHENDIKKVIKTALDYMNQRKLLENRSSHSTIIASIKATMLENSHETEEHAERLIELSKMVGHELGLGQKELDNLELFAMLHDIGKIGISDQILNKTAKLSEDEWFELKKHPVIGYRIAMSSPELAPIAEYILYHHERWDGHGYPQNLAGESIPLLSRILAVIDAYDAMTHDRSYRRAMPHAAAVEEIEKNIGTQFDPHIARLFIDDVLPEAEIQEESH